MAAPDDMTMNNINGKWLLVIFPPHSWPYLQMSIF
jgi:hypothetical protein